jgi:hypothetical protein
MAMAYRVRATTFTTPSDREIAMTCVVDVPRRIVFDAWVNPEHLPRRPNGSSPPSRGAATGPKRSTR